MMTVFALLAFYNCASSAFTKHANKFSNNTICVTSGVLINSMSLHSLTAQHQTQNEMTHLPLLCPGLTRDIMWVDTMFFVGQVSSQSAPILLAARRNTLCLHSDLFYVVEFYISDSAHGASLVGHKPRGRRGMLCWPWSHFSTLSCFAVSR